MMVILFLWALLTTFAFLVTVVYANVCFRDLEDMKARFASTCDKAKQTNDRATATLAEFDKLEAKYLERCKELRDLRRQVSESILSLAESAKSPSGDIS